MIDRNLSYFVYKKQILEKKECDEIIEWCEKNCDCQVSKIGRDGDDQSKSDLVRTSKTGDIGENCPYLDLILSRLNEAFLEYCEEYLEDSYFISIQDITKYGYRIETLQYTKYEKENFYRWHVDQGSDTGSIHRLISFVLYLNDEFTGGETEFAFNKYKGQPGEVIIFPSNFLFPHCGKKVTSGTKKIITTWLNNLDMRE